MNRNDKPSPSPGYIILGRMGPHDLIFEFPRLTLEVQDEFDAVIDVMRSRPAFAKHRLQRLIQDFPEHVDARHHLALTWFWEGDWQTASGIWREGTEFVLRCLPDNFPAPEDRLLWSMLENRPFLRLYQGHGLGLLRTGKVHEALAVFENRLILNPADNQGNRALAIACHFALRNSKGVLSICKRYPQDALEQSVYGRPLALFQLGQIAQARKALEDAARYFPRIARELLKKRHSRPRNWNDERITIGGQDQAYSYWRNHGIFWEQTPGALAWLRQTVLPT